MMMDKNGREIKTGDVVRITGAFFKNDNGLYFVTDMAGDPSYCGTDISLTRICKNGHISTAKYRVSFWPLVSFCSDKMKNAVAWDWNREHAEIEVVDGIDRSEIRDHFVKEVERSDEFLKRYAPLWGKHSSEYVKYVIIRDHYRDVVASIC
jgi:hypothetical protein